VGQFYILQLDGHLLITYLLAKNNLQKNSVNILHDLISFPGLLEKYYVLKNPENKRITVGLFRITENSN
jgi:hypothetical protein